MIGKYSDTMTFEYIMSTVLAAVPNTVDKREGSIIYDALAPAVAEFVKLYIELDVIMDETFVDTASMQYLKLRAKERGVPIKSATFAVVEGTFKPADLEIETGKRFNCGAVNYYVSEYVSAGVYQLVCETAGTDGNIYSGTLIPIDYIDGLQTANITDCLIPGENADTADTLRVRYYESINAKAYGGNIADYKQKVNEIDGVGGVKVYPVWNGGGTVKLTIINSDFGVPSSTLIDKVQEIIDPDPQGTGIGVAPIGHTVTVIGVQAYDIAITSNITFQDGWSYASAAAVLKNKVDEYFTELSKSWADSKYIIVRISQIESRLLDLDSIVLDIGGTRLNGQTANITLGSDYIPNCTGVGEAV